MRKLKQLQLILWTCMALNFELTAYAGVMPDKTRLIFHEGQSQRSLMLANTNAYSVVVQTWIDNGEGNQSPENTASTMVAIPSVFKLQSSAIQGLRIVQDSSSFAKDRESVSWLNIYEIPPTKTITPLISTQVAVAMNTQIKIFYRPANLPIPPEKVSSLLSFSLKQQAGSWVLVCHNPTPYHASFSSLGVVGKGNERVYAKALDMMTPPLSDKAYPLAPFSLGHQNNIIVNYTLIDDEGHYNDGSSIVQIL